MKNRNSIEIKRDKNDTFRIVITKDGEKHSYPMDAPELVEYQEFIQWQIKLMKETNAGSVKLSVSE